VEALVQLSVDYGLLADKALPVLMVPVVAVAVAAAAAVARGDGYVSMVPDLAVAVAAAAVKQVQVELADSVGDHLIHYSFL
jgi:hypothetical protein